MSDDMVQVSRKTLDKLLSKVESMLEEVRQLKQGVKKA